MLQVATHHEEALTNQIVLHCGQHSLACVLLCNPLFWDPVWLNLPKSSTSANFAGLFQCASESNLAVALLSLSDPLQHFLDGI